MVFLPFSSFDALSELTNIQWYLLAFCGLNTLVAYGCFSEALAHIEASRVSAVIAMTPLVTLLLVQSIPMPDIVVESLQTITILRSNFVVTGSIMTATLKGRS